VNASLIGEPSAIGEYRVEPLTFGEVLVLSSIIDPHLATLRRLKVRREQDGEAADGIEMQIQALEAFKAKVRPPERRKFVAPSMTCRPEDCAIPLER
jgi:hypothetical protein